VINTGTADREVSVAFVVGEETTTKTVSLSAGASQKVTHTVSVPRGEGSPELDVYVNGTYVGLIDIVAQASTLNGSEEGVPTAETTPGTESPPPQSTTRETTLSGGSESTISSTGTPGFGVVAAVTAFLVGLILVRQRSHE
jgi:PGF-CTERM protein